MARTEPETLLYRVAIAAGLPAVFSRRFLAKDPERAASLTERGFVAELYYSPGRDRVFYRVVGEPARPCVAIGMYRCLNVEEIVLYSRGGTGISRVLFHGHSVPDLEREVDGYQKGLAIDEAVAWERRRVIPRARRSS